MKPLPSHHYLAEVISRDIGKELTAEDIRDFEEYINKSSKIEPGTITAGIGTIVSIAVNLVIGVGFRLLAGQQKQAPTASTRITPEQGASITTARRYAPTYSFDSLQEPAKLGDIIPLIFTENLDLPEQSNPYRPAGRYGTTRVNLPLLWSQVLSLGGSNLIKIVAMLGQAKIGSIDPKGFALGNTSLTAYDLPTEGASEIGSSVTIYFSRSGGRLKSGDRILGRLATADPGNAQNQGGLDVFSIRGENNSWQRHFCFASTPTANTVFGLYGHIPNRFMYRVNPVVRPTVGCVVVSGASSTRIDCEDEAQTLATYWKSRYFWSARSGIIWSSVNGNSAGSYNAVVGTVIRYRLTNGTDAPTVIKFNSSNTDNDRSDQDGSETCQDVGSGVAAWQSNAAENLIIGERYKIGSCYAVLTEKIPANSVFISDADFEPVGGGTGVEYLFVVVEPGIFDMNTDCILGHDFSGGMFLPPQWNQDEESIDTLPSGRRWSVCTEFSQIFRVSEAIATIERDCFMFEIGIQATLGITVSGLCNFRSSLSVEDANVKAGVTRKGRVGRDTVFRGTSYQSGSTNITTTRYAFFALLYRSDGGAFVLFPHTFGMSGSTSQAKNDYLKFQMPSVQPRWEIKFRPLSGYEIAKGLFSGDLILLESSTIDSYDSRYANGMTVTFSGRKLDFSANSNFFRLTSVEPTKNLGLQWTDTRVPAMPSMLDAEGGVAEKFVYPEVSTSIDQGPEFKITYINTISTNQQTANYEDISCVGMNLTATAEFNQISQLSARVLNGNEVKKLRQPGTTASSSLFPDILRFLQTSKEVGAGESVSDRLIDLGSYTESANWCWGRRYFFNGPVIEAVNVNAWGEETAKTMLLDFYKKNGRYTLRPKFSFDNPVEIVGLFGKGQIRPGTFAIELIDEDQRRPIQVSVIWRQERNEACSEASGFFPVNRQVTVRRAQDPDTVPIQTYDLSAYCNNEYHAIDFAVSLIKERVLITKKGKVNVGTQGLIGSIGAFDCIKIAETLSSYRGIASGRIKTDGTLITSDPSAMNPGTHDCITWAGDGNEPIEQVVTVGSTGKTAAPVGVVYAKKVTVEQTPCYKIMDLDIDEQGDIAMAFIEWPLDNNGFSMMVKDWTTYQSDANWSIIR
jgi:hypothetical protein